MHFSMSDCGSDGSAKKEYKCENCGDPFEDYPSRRETRERQDYFCSRDCKSEYQKNGKVVECSWCGDDTYKPKCQLDQMGGYSLDNHFCDKECETAFKESEWVGENHPSWNGGNVDLVCDECSDTYDVKPAKAEDSQFCSDQCHQDSYYIDVQCDNCGVSLERTTFLATEKTEHNLCSDECYSEWWSEQQRGSNNTSYKTAGGKVGIDAVRKSIGDVAWDRRARHVRERDEYTCQLCGEQDSDRDLDVHHIIPVASGGTNDPVNLMSLCGSCHKTVETYTEQYVDTHLFSPVGDNAEVLPESGDG